MTATANDHPEAWQLDPRLARDSVEIADIGLIHVRAMASTAWPWLLLIPRHPGAVELFDLPAPLQTALWSLTVETGVALKREFGADKINVGAIGNIVSQLHVHVIARQVGDPGWPAPVWGRSETPLPVDAVADRLLRLRALVAQIARS